VAKPSGETLDASGVRHLRRLPPDRRRLVALLILCATVLPVSGAIAQAHMSDDDPLVTGDDPNHPIPYISKLDLLAERKTGGADLVIVIATPLRGDERSLRRLLRKMDTYLGFIASTEYRQKYGAPNPATTRIVVTIDERSDPTVFDLLKRCEAWTLDNHTTLVVERRPPLK